MQIVPTHHMDAADVDQLVQEAGAILESGGLVVFPTETVYGVAASARSEAGLGALRAFKERPENQPFTIHLPNAETAQRYVDGSDPVLRRLIHKVLPGPVTLVVDVDDPTIADRLKALGLGLAGRDRLYHGNTVGLRCPALALAQRILGAVDAPVLASSANRRGQPPPQDAQAAAAAVGDAAQMVLDGGRCRYAKPSTIVRAGSSGHQLKLTVERAGVYDERYIQKLMRWTILFVCSGNTCRSPMAEGLAKQILAQRRGVAVDDLDAAGVQVLSAGTYTMSGMPASAEAVQVMADRGIDLTPHRSRALTVEMIHEADVIFCMTRAHMQAVLAMAASAAEKIVPLDPTGDVVDPVGSSRQVYQRCAELIQRSMIQRLDERGF